MDSAPKLLYSTSSHLQAQASKMVKFINRFTGTEMWVADDRKDEYIGAGHTLAPEACPVEKPKKEPEKKTVKKTTRKR